MPPHKAPRSSPQPLPAPVPPPSKPRPILLLFTGGLLAYLTSHLLAHFNILTVPVPNPDYIHKEPLRIVAVGDLHGDYANALAVLRMAGIANRKGEWVAGRTVFVQTGDIVDRGPDTIRLYKLMQNLSEQAVTAGGKVIPLLGNHEVMNMMEDYRYVTPEDIESFGGLEQRKRIWGRDGWLGKYLRTWDVVADVNGTIFLHGGLHPKWAHHGIPSLNTESQTYLQTLPPSELYHVPLFGGDGPLWYRGYAQDDERVVCKTLQEALSALKAHRMVIGHTPQLSGEILSRCGNQVLVIDVGISSVYGGNRAALEIVGDRVVGVYEGRREVIAE
ncbi:hypothetical protein SpCBS45565_g01167 [Spizellomyces sp. 'palustris']|nr:hypothetical protein SpCBS45565_g01167 [Spizellomyces sp. 'palustris']